MLCSQIFKAFDFRRSTSSEKRFQHHFLELNVYKYFEVEKVFVSNLHRNLILEIRCQFQVMEDRLESYRLRKRRLEKVQSIKERFFKMLTINTSQSNPSETSVNIEVKAEEIRFHRYLKLYFSEKGN